MKYVGVDIGGTNLKAGLVDESGTLLATQKMKVASIVDREGLAWTVASLVQELAKAANIPVSDVASVGVGVPGTVDIRAGSIAYTCNLPLRDVPLRKLFHKYLNIPLYIENDANCAALAEFHVGAGRESKRFVTITLGTGVGGGVLRDVLSNQKPYIFVKHFYACPTLIGALLCALCWRHLGDIPSMLLGAAVILVLTRWVKPTKGLHPIVFILASAVVGVVFRF